MDEYRTDLFEGLPLFASSSGGVAELTPPTCVTDPATAVVAAQSREARKAVVQGTARCLMVLYQAEDGLTDNEAVAAHALAYPESVVAKGMTGFVRMALRNWCLCKPNGDVRNWKEKNLNLIQQTDQTRLNPQTGKLNVVFKFIHAPTVDQLQAWRALAC